MTKYIELLRKHQQEQGGIKNADAEVAGMIEVEGALSEPVVQRSFSSNPYSTPANASTIDESGAELEKTSGLVEENVSVADVATEESVEPKALLADDESHVEVPCLTKTDGGMESKESSGLTSDAVALDVTKAASNINAFHINTWLKNISQATLKLFKAAEKEEVSDISPINEQLRLLVDFIDITPGALDALELEINRSIKSIRDLDASVGDLVQKSIMMMLYAIKTGQQLKLQQQELLHHVTAAMLHHIGMAQVSEEIRHKKERLTSDEIKRIKQAPESAYQYLQACHIEEESILFAASQASERYDGSGSTGLKGHAIAWSARLIGLLSMFEALIHFRPYRQRLLPRDAIRELVNHHKKAFDPVMLKALIESISLYPVGTFVQINTGEIGQVIAVHSKFPLRPIIHISMDKHGAAVAEREINLKTQPNLMIQKCMYEEGLEELRQERIQQ